MRLKGPGGNAERIFAGGTEVISIQRIFGKKVGVEWGEDENRVLKETVFILEGRPAVQVIKAKKKSMEGAGLGGKGQKKGTAPRGEGGSSLKRAEK